jgi:hypothetical protein
MFNSPLVFITVLFLLPLIMASLVIILAATSSTWLELTDLISEGRHGLRSLVGRFKT